MKELSIEEKAKRYDEAIKSAKSKIKNDKDHVLYENDVIELFPELAEFEDEKIRKAIIRHFQTGTEYTSFSGLPKSKILSWLEKQGEQKFLDDIAKEVTKDKDAAISFLKSTGIINENGELADEYKIEQGEQNYQEKVDNLHNYLYGEQKPAWSEEDEKMLNDILMCGERHCYLDAGNIAWLKSLEDRVQPKHEWSEKDESMRTRCIGILGKCYMGELPTKLEEELNWLKSLRPQNRWKPSDEQMNALWSATEKYLESDDENVRKLRGEVLESLYEDLKKLKE